MKCRNCAGLCYFEPIQGETFICCCFYKETAEDINLGTGFSPATVFCWKNDFCDKFQEGKSICVPSEKSPFDLSDFRKKGEEALLKKMFLVKSPVKK